MRRALIILFLVLALAYVNYLAYSSEVSINEGHVVLLELAPVDPRSLLQGDFMRLDYALERDLRDATFESERGQLVLVLDDNHVGEFARFRSDTTSLRPNEIAVNFRGQSWNVTVASDSFFFQEGEGERFAEAEYAELRVTEDGRVFLVGLRDGDFRPIK